MNFNIIISSHNSFHRETYKNDKIRTLGKYGSKLSLFSKAWADGGGQSRSIGKTSASLHAYGGAFYSVTCSQRKYHYFCTRVMAVTFCRAVISALVFIASAPADRLCTYRTYLLALFSFLSDHRPVKAHRFRCALADR